MLLNTNNYTRLLLLERKILKIFWKWDTLRAFIPAHKGSPVGAAECLLRLPAAASLGIGRGFLPAEIYKKEGLHVCHAELDPERGLIWHGQGDIQMNSFGMPLLLRGLYHSY